MRHRLPIGVLLGSLTLVGLVLAVYGQVRHHEFVDFDTQDYITENPRVLSGLTWEGVRWALSSTFAANWFPLTWISHMLDVELFGVQPGAHHLVNVALHALSSVVLFLAWVKMTAELGKSWFLAAVFALHPLHVESVAWIVERKDTLSTLFGWSCLLAWAAYAKRPSAVRYLAALACLALGLMSKAMLVTWPCVLLLLDVWPLQRTALGWRRLLVEKIPFALLSFGSALATLAVQRAGGAVQGLDNLALPTRLANAAVSVVRYLANAFWPHDLAFYYPHAREGLATSEVAIAVTVIAGISIAAFVLRQRAPYFAIGWSFYLGTLVPVIGLVQVGGQAYADRYTYVPLLGISVVVAWGVGALVTRLAVPFARIALPLIAALVVAALAYGTWWQTATWRDTRTLAQHALSVSRDNHVAHNVLAIGLTRAGELDEAIAHMREALRIAPGDLDTRLNLCAVLVRRGQPQEAEVEARRALALAPDRPKPHAHLGGALLAQGRFEEAVVAIERALHGEPDMVSAHANLGAALEALDRPLEARAAYARVLRLSPSDANARLGLARLWEREGSLERAAAEYETVLRYEPHRPDASLGLARVRHASGRSREAVALLESALRERPDAPPLQAELAWVLATATDASVTDIPRAIELAERSVTRTQERAAGALDALAVAYAASGDFARAAAVGTKALARVRESGDRELAARIERRVAAYQAGRIDRSVPR